MFEMTMDMTMELQMRFQGPLELLGQRLDATRKLEKRQEIARAMIGLGPTGIAALCERAVSSEKERAGQIAAVLAEQYEVTEEVLLEIEKDQGSARREGAMRALVRIRANRPERHG